MSGLSTVVVAVLLSLLRITPLNSQSLDCHFTGLNIAQGKHTTQGPGTYQVYDSSRAVDGNTDTDHRNGSCSHSGLAYNKRAYWTVSLGLAYVLKGIKIYRRNEWPERYINFKVIGSQGQKRQTLLHDDKTATRKLYEELVMNIPISSSEAFSEVTIEVPPHEGEPDNGRSMMMLCEVQIYSVNHSCAAPNQSDGLKISLRNGTGIMDYVNGLISSGTVLDFRCNRSHVLIGETSVTCRPGGAFSSKPPFCREITAAFTVRGESDDGYLTYKENTTLEMNCEVDSEHPQFEFTLLKGGKPLYQTMDTTAAKYSIPNLSCSDTGIYWCIARNTGDGHRIPGRIERYVLVQCPPRPLGNISNRTTYGCAIGDNVTLFLAFTAYPSPKPHRWYKQQTDGNWTRLLTGASAGDEFASLLITDVQQLDFRKYRLEIMNNLGTLEHLFFITAYTTDDVPAAVQYSKPLSSTMLFIAAVGAAGIALVESVVIIVVVIVCMRQRNKATQDTSKRNKNESNQVQLVNVDLRTESTYQNAIESKAVYTPTIRTVSHHVYDEPDAEMKPGAEDFADIPLVV